MLSNIKAKLITEAVKERDKYFTKDAPSKKKSDELIQATAATVGFFSEMNHHRKEKKSKSDIKEVEAATVTGPDTTSQTSEERASEPALAPTDLAAAFLNRHPSPTSADSHPLPDLITPVLIPQRRPNIRGRGFALAYAPILSTFDISQNAFLDFIITLNASIKPSPYLSAINLTSFACEASPEPLIGFLIGEAVETVTDAIMEVQSRMRSNDFLHKINDGFFMPRGLFAFVGMWRPNGNTNERAAARCVGEVTSTSHPQVNVLSTAALIEESKTIAAKGGWRSFQNQVHLAMLRADGEIAAIAPAPLLWPSAEEIAAAETPGKKFKNKSRIDRAGMWVGEHVDKHSQVTWIQEHHDHPLVGSLPEPEFRSRYADPNHAASSGDVVALLTGGQWHVKEGQKKAEREAQRRLEKERKKEKKLRLLENKARSNEEQSRAQSETGSDSGSKANHNSQDSEIEQSKSEASNDVKAPNGEFGVKDKGSSGFSNLLEHNLLYLVIVQHSSLSDRL